MKDAEIVGLFLKRDERAVEEAKKKYGAYCFSVARNVLGNPEDAEECVNSALMKAWESIPPQRPERLGGFLAKVTRNIAFNRFKEQRRHKRGGGETALVLEELAEVLPAGGDASSEAEFNELKKCVNAFLKSLPEKERRVFMSRAYNAEPIRYIVRREGMTENAVMSLLSRTRKKLRQYLVKEGLIDE